MENELRPRARRFKLKMPVLFQRPGADSWSEAESIDISHTGLLFATCHGGDLRAGEGVAFIVCLPGCFEEAGGEVHCTGRVVRVCVPEEDRPLIAVTIDKFTMIPPGAAALSRRGPPGTGDPGGAS